MPFPAETPNGSTNSEQLMVPEEKLALLEGLRTTAAQNHADKSVQGEDNRLDEGIIEEVD